MARETEFTSPVSVAVFEFTLSEDDQLVRKTARDFAQDRLSRSARTHESAGDVDARVVREYRDLGLHAVDVPEACGGGGWSPLGKVLVVEELAAADAGAALRCESLGPAFYPLIEMGGEREARELVGARGWVVNDVDGRLRIGGGRVRGTWPWVPASNLDAVVVHVGDSAHLVKTGFDLAPVKPCSLHAAGSSEIVFDAPIAVTFEGVRGRRRAEARSRLFAAAALLGVARAAFEYSKQYSRERVAFGRPVAHHQGNAFTIAELATRLHGARLSTWRAAWALDREGDPTTAAASAFLDAAEVALRCGEEGVQLLGGHGYMQDHPSEKWMREARTLAQLFGGKDAALDALTSGSFDAPGRLGFESPSWAEEI